MDDGSVQLRVMAQAVYEVRLLLSGYLGSSNEGDMAVRRAAHLAYALHNQALAAVEGGTFDAARAVASVSAVDRLLGSDFGPRFEELLRAGG